MSRTWSRAALAGAVVLLIAACGANAPASSNPASQAPATATAASTAASSSAASATGGASGSAAAVDPMNAISIAPPYTLGQLDRVTSAAFEAGMKAALGSMGTVHMGARDVKKGGTDAGFVMAMTIDGVQGVNPATFLDLVAQGAAGSAQGSVTSRTIEGRQVRLIDSGSGGIAMYVRDDGTIVFAYARAAEDSAGVITAIIQGTE